MATKRCLGPASVGEVIPVVFLAAFVCLATSDASAVEKSKSVRDWTVRCTMDMCQATTEVRAGGGAVHAKVERSAKPGATISVSITRDPPDPVDDTVFVSVEGAGLAPRSATSADGRLYSLRPMPSDDPLIDALKNGRSLSISTMVEGSTVSDKLSLSGISAAFLFMDEFQDRLDRTDAIVRVGNRPLHAATSGQANAGALDIEEIEFAALPVQFRRIAVEKAECNPVSDQGPPKIASRVALPDGLVLWETSCWFAAYNFGSAYYISPANDPEAGGLVEFASPSAAAGDTYNSFSLTNASWDPKTLQLTSWHKSRGVGDCGTFQRHQYRDGIFSLSEYREKECDGVWRDPSEYPLIYKARD